ncbi:MAG: MlaD family protein, partial [Caulobacterales bacterium]|nr:MlaD family protein [Caulobacterales bacterium]
GGAVAWQSLNARGPSVEIRFESAEGVRAGRTQIRHKDVVVGEVEEVTLTEDLNAVIVKARLEKEMAAYLGETTQFWIVSARIDGSQVSGLGTLLSGSYIEVDWSGDPGQRRRSFEGLTAPPLTEPGAPGRRVTLRSDRGGGLNVGSTVYFRQLPVGRVESRRLSDDARHVVFDAFIDAPFHEQISAATRFWNVSGFDVTAGADGFTVNVESVDAFLSGGVAFEEISADIADPLTEDGAEFRIFASRAAAEESLFQDEGDEGYRFIAEFGESVRGLRAGAPIEFDGIRVGEVLDVAVEAIEDGEGELRIYAILQFQPSRLGLHDLPPAELRAAFDSMVARGMRLQLASGNLLTGALMVRVVEEADPEPAAIDFAAAPYPALPTGPSDTAALPRDVETLVNNLATLPMEDLVVAATSLLRNADEVVSVLAENGAPEALAEAARNLDTASEDLPALVAGLNALSGSADLALAGLGPDSEMYSELTAAARDLRLAARSIAELAERLEEQPNSLITGR